MHIPQGANVAKQANMPSNDIDLTRCRAACVEVCYLSAGRAQTLY